MWVSAAPEGSPPALVMFANADLSLSQKCVEGLRPTLYWHRIGDFGRLALGAHAQQHV
jgi:hypothetical protein